MQMPKHRRAADGDWPAARKRVIGAARDTAALTAIIEKRVDRILRQKIQQRGVVEELVRNLEFNSGLGNSASAVGDDGVQSFPRSYFGNIVERNVDPNASGFEFLICQFANPFEIPSLALQIQTSRP